MAALMEVQLLVLKWCWQSFEALKLLVRKKKTYHTLEINSSGHTIFLILLPSDDAKVKKEHVKMWKLGVIIYYTWYKNKTAHCKSHTTECNKIEISRFRGS